MDMKEISFEVDGKNYKLRKPTNQEYREAKKIYNITFNEAVQAKCPFKAQITEILTERGLWNDAKQAELEGLQRDILDLEWRLHKGGIKKSAARQLALNLGKLRDKVRALIIPINDFNRHTAEGQADNAHFDYLVSVCLTNEDGSPYFANYDDYLNRDTDVVGIHGARKLAKSLYELEEDYEASLIENQVLKELNFVNDKYQLINDKGHLIDEEGRLIDEKGRFVDEEGNFVDLLGHKLDENGAFKGERGVFIDDEVDNKIEDSAPVKKKK